MLTMIFFVSSIVAQGDTEPRSPTEEYQALVRGWDDALRVYARAEEGAKSAEEKAKVFATFPKPVFQERFLELARKHPEDSASIEAVAWIFRNPWFGPVADRNADEAIDLLVRYQLKSEHLGKALLELADPLGSNKGAGGLNDRAERLLRAAMKESPHREVRGLACYSLARYLRFHAKYRSANMGESVANEMGKESEVLFERVIQRYADVKTTHRATLGVWAEGELFELRQLAIGKAAPEIEGEDVEGKRFKLSDYRGKVVVLSFSGNWCGPCRSMYPEERGVVARLRDKPFAFLSVNTDDNRETLRKSIESGEITWRCWWDGGKEGPIATRWGVDSFPTVYVLDGDGVIRLKGGRTIEMEKAIATLLDEGSADKPPQE